MGDCRARKSAGKILLGFLVLSLIMQAGASTAQETEDVSIHMPGESVVLNGNGLQTIISGFWHVLEFVSPTADISVELTKGTETYTWSYDGSSWEDLKHDLFIDGTKCSYIGGKASFWIAVDSSASPGIWQLEIDRAGDVIVENVELAARTGGIGFSTPDFFIVVPPFTEKVMDTAQTGQYAKVQNEANVPAEVIFTLGDDNVQVGPGADFIHPGSSGEYSMIYSAPLSAPQRKEISGEVLVKFKYVGPSLDMVQLVSSFNYPFDINIFVGDPDLTLVERGEYTLQYTESVRIQYNETLALPLNINGVNTVVLDIHGIDCEVLSIAHDGEYRESPMVLELTGGSVEYFTIIIEPAIQEGEAFLVYDIDGEEYTTLIEIEGPVNVQDDDTANSENIELNKVLPPVLIGLLIGTVLISTIYKKKRRGKK